MTYIVYAKDVTARQWLGRLLNEAGLCRESTIGSQSRVRFVRSFEEAHQVATECPPGGCVTIVWSPEISASEKTQLKTIPGDVLTVDQSTTSDAFSNCLSPAVRS